MNDQNNQNENELIRKFTESLNKLEVPPGLRASNRNFIRKAIDSLPVEANRPLHWYRRRIAVPLPVAAGVLLAFCLQLGLYFYPAGRFKEPEGTGATVSQTHPIGQLENSVESYYSEQGVYIAGIGFVEKTKNYFYSRESPYGNN